MDGSSPGGIRRSRVFYNTIMTGVAKGWGGGVVLRVVSHFYPVKPAMIEWMSMI